MLSSSKSPSSTDNVPSKKKRKISSSVESKSPKIIKLATKENLVKSVPEKEEEDASERKLNSSNDSIEIITSVDEKKGPDQNDQQKARKSDSTPKNRNLGKNKKVDRSQQKPGALTKFLKRTDREVEESDISHDNNLSKLKNKDCQDTQDVHKEKNEICLNENSDVQLIPSELQDTSRLNETNRVANKDVDSSFQESDCDITILSSDNETSSELDKSISNKNKETTDRPATPVNSKTDKDIKEKIKRLTPKQLEKRQEIARRKEEKKRLKMVCIVYRRDSNFIFISL